MKRHNLLGKTFSKLVVIGDLGSDEMGKSVWRCLCSCGNTCTGTASVLNAGKKKDCGCTLKDKKHGLSKTKLYKIWGDMKNRCHNPNNTSYNYYGAKGVVVCDRWQDFKNFYEDMAESYEEGLSIERIDNNLDYCAENCKWIPISEQPINRKNSNRHSKYRGVVKRGDKWRVQINIDKKTTNFGTYFCEEEAAKRFNEVVSELNLKRVLNEV